MKVLIISDTHGKSSCLKQIHDIVGDVDMLIHLGDVEGDEKLIPVSYTHLTLPTT